MSQEPAMIRRVVTWIWRDATQPRLRFNRRLPLGRGWAVEVLYPFGEVRPLIIRYQDLPPGSCTAERGWSVRIPVIARALSLAKESETA